MNINDIVLRILADGLVVPIALIGAWVMLRIPAAQRYQLWTRAFLTGVTGLLFAKIISLLYQEGQRPYELLGAAPKASYLPNPGFPSDHALLVFMVTLVVWASTKNVRVSLVLLGLSILVGVGRVLALVHTPLDIAGGILCVCLAGLCLYGRSLFTRTPPSPDGHMR